MGCKLSVNLNKVALLRNQRDYGVPSVVKAAETVLDAGAAGVTVHPRPDERHIRPGDVYELAAVVAGKAGVEFNIEGNPFERGFLDLVEAVGPAQATLVPDDPSQRTSDHGWSLPEDIERLKPVVEKLRGWGVRVSLFMDPICEGIGHVRETGAERVELYTEGYATAFRSGRADANLPAYVASANVASEMGLGVNAGHDLNLANLGMFLQAVPNVVEVSIGHELTADALWMGLEGAVKGYLGVIARAE